MRTNRIEELVEFIIDDFGQADCVYPQDKWDVIEHLERNYGASSSDATDAWENYINTNELCESVAEYQPSIYV